MDNSSIYLIIEREFVNSGKNIYKIGRTNQPFPRRYSQYPNDSHMILHMACNNCVKLEKIIKKKFKKKFNHRKDIGEEYFEGSRWEMLDIIYDAVKNDTDKIENEIEDEIKQEKAEKKRIKKEAEKERIKKEAEKETEQENIILHFIENNIILNSKTLYNSTELYELFNEKIINDIPQKKFSQVIQNISGIKKKRTNKCINFIINHNILRQNFQ